MVDPDMVTSRPNNIVLLFIKSLIYNHRTSLSYCFNAFLLDPLLLLIHASTKRYGTFFVVVVFMMLVIFVLIAYTLGK